MTAATIDFSQAKKLRSAELRAQPAFGYAVIDAIRRSGAATPRDVARSSGASELIVRSVLEALAAVGLVVFDEETGEYEAQGDTMARGAGVASA